MPRNTECSGGDSDKEEIGSLTNRMDSTFMENTVAELVNLTQDTYLTWVIEEPRTFKHAFADVGTHDPAFRDVPA